MVAGSHLLLPSAAACTPAAQSIERVLSSSRTCQPAAALPIHSRLPLDRGGWRHTTLLLYRPKWHHPIAAVGVLRRGRWRVVVPGGGGRLPRGAKRVSDAVPAVAQLAWGTGGV